jgi:hemin uptake protein HemP
MGEYKKQSQQRPDMLAKLPRNDKTRMRLTSQTLLGTANELIIQHDAGKGNDSGFSQADLSHA